MLVLVLVSGLLLCGCGKKEEETKIKKETTTKQEDTTETATEAKTPQDKAITGLNAAQEEVSEAVSEVEADIRDIEKIDTSQDDESGY